EDATGTLLVRLSIAPTEMEGFTPGKRIQSIVSSVDLSNNNNAVGLCLVDCGTIAIAPDNLRVSRTLSYTARVYLEAKIGVQPTNEDNDFLFTEIILLPLNKHYMVFEGTRPPLSHNGNREGNFNHWGWRDGGELRDYAEESLIINGFEPSGTGAVLARYRREGETTFFPQGGGSTWDPIQVYDVETSELTESYYKSGASPLVTEANYPRRFYFLWYKRLEDGTIWSFDAFNTAIQVFGAKQYVTLPAR